MAKIQTAKAPETTLPEIKSPNGELRDLKKEDFPMKTKQGKIAFLDYQIVKLQEKKHIIQVGETPQGKLERRRKGLLKRLEALDKELKAAGK